MCVCVCIASQRFPAVLLVVLKKRCMLQPAWCQITCASRAKVERWVEEVEAVVDESADSQRTAPKSFDRIKKNQKQHLSYCLFGVQTAAKSFFNK